MSWWSFYRAPAERPEGYDDMHTYEVESIPSPTPKDDAQIVAEIIRLISSAKDKNKVLKAAAVFFGWA